MNEPTREMTIKELEEEYARINEERQNIERILKKKKQEEEERKIAQLALDKKKRKEEVDKVCKQFLELRNAYMRDYGSYNYTTDDGYTSLLDILRFW